MEQTKMAEIPAKMDEVMLNLRFSQQQYRQLVTQLQVVEGMKAQLIMDGYEPWVSQDYNLTTQLKMIRNYSIPAYKRRITDSEELLLQNNITDIGKHQRYDLLPYLQRELVDLLAGQKEDLDLLQKIHQEIQPFMPKGYQP